MNLFNSCILLGCFRDVPQNNMGNGDFRDLEIELEGDGVLGCKWDNINCTCPLGWLLIGCLFWNILKIFWTFKSFKKSWKFSSHYYVMVYINNLPKLWKFQKISNPLTSSFIVLKHWLQCFKVFLGIFHSLNYFQTIYTYICIYIHTLKIRLCKSNAIWNFFLKC
jgi:hypothetical protein